VEHVAVGIEHAGLEPFPNQLQHRTALQAFLQHISAIRFVEGPDRQDVHVAITDKLFCQYCTVNIAPM